MDREEQTSGVPDTQNSRLKLAVVAATNRRERYLKRLMDEVRAQSMPNWVLYVVHDGPNPRTRRLVEGAAARDPRIRYHELDHHVGNWGHTPRREALRSILTEEPDTDYVWFWDDDDAYAPDSLENVQAALIDAALPDVLLVPFDMDPGVTPAEDKPIEELQLGQVMGGNLVLRPQLAAEMYDRILKDIGRRRGADYALFDTIRTAGTYTIRRTFISPPGSRDGHRFFHVLRTRLGIPMLGLARWRWYRMLRCRARTKSGSSHEVFSR